MEQKQHQHGEQAGLPDGTDEIAALRARGFMSPDEIEAMQAEHGKQLACAVDYWRQKAAEAHRSPEFACVNGIVLSARNIEYVDFRTPGVAHVHLASGRMRSFDDPREVAGLAGLFGLNLAPPDEPPASEVN